MAKSIKDHLIDTLENLDDDEFKKLKSKVVDRKEEPRIRKGTVQNADRLDFAGKLISTFTEDAAVRVMVEVLELAGFNEEAVQLRNNFRKLFDDHGRGGPSRNPDTSSKMHFIDTHRVALIRRVCQVEAILDQLLSSGVITHEAYSEIAAEKTNQAKMRALYNGPLVSCGDKGKDVLYNILKELQGFLIDDLHQT